jgi:two-component system nitrogen regulation response regulator NtrX
VVAATNRNLETDVQQGRFREDLLYRLNVIEIVVPALRERADDILALARRLLAFYARSLGRAIPTLSPSAEQTLAQYAWPGNVRELRNAIERLLLLCDAQVDRDDVRQALPRAARGASSNAAAGTLAERVDAFERQTVLAELERHNFQMTETAKALGLERSHLYKKCQQLSIELKKR